MPKNSKDVERFLGLANYHRSFIKNFAHIAVPLYKVTGKQEFQCVCGGGGGVQAEAFKALKSALIHLPVLTLPNHSDDFILDTDASDSAIGAELLHVQNGEERVIAYGSVALTAEQLRYCTTRKICSLLFALRVSIDTTCWVERLRYEPTITALFGYNCDSKSQRASWPVELKN